MKQKSEIILESDQTASEAVRQILCFLFTHLQEPVAGTLDGRDPIPLHDFRVAIRRTRSAIGQLKRALPPMTVTRFAPDFKWLGEITGPCRDLDVWLLALEARRRDPTGSEETALDQLQEEVGEARDRAHAEVVRGVSSERFSRLFEDWKVFLSDWPMEPDPPPDAETPVPIFAERRIFKAFKRVRRRGHDLGGGQDALALHQLRIAAKRFRYLLEFFRSLDRGGETKARIKDLKVLQDVLGELNDLEFQRTRLATYSRGLDQTSTGKALAWVQQLDSEIVRRRGELRREVQGVLEPVIRRSPSAR